MTETTPSGVPEQVLQTFSEAVARSLAAQGAGRTPTGPAIFDLGEGEGLRGSFTLRITYDDTTYALTVTVPTAEGEPYVFKVTMQKKGVETPTTLADFEFVSSTRWKVEVTSPRIPITDTLSIDELHLTVADGAAIPPSR